MFRTYIHTYIHTYNYSHVLSYIIYYIVPHINNFKARFDTKKHPHQIKTEAKYDKDCVHIPLHMGQLNKTCFSSSTQYTHKLHNLLFTGIPR